MQLHLCIQNHEKRKEAVVMLKEIKEKCRACGKELAPFPVIDERGRRYISTVCEEYAKKYAN